MSEDKPPKAPSVPAPDLAKAVPSQESSGLQESDRREVEQLIAQIDMRDANSIIFFGNRAQQELTDISDQMLEGVKNKDLGRAGDALNEIVLTLKGFDIDQIDPNKKPGFVQRLFGGRSKPLQRFIHRYDEVRKQIEQITDRLERHKTQLLTDVTTLDRLYDAALNYFHTLERYIAAGEGKLAQVDDELLPQLASEAEASDDMVKAQQLKDLRSARDDLERRVHDLKLTRAVTMQSLPSIRLVQENDKSLINKINSVLANTVPLWRQQLAQTVTIWRSSEAAKALESASDLTNELLEANAENLREANAQVRAQLERGVFDIESVKLANKRLVETIDDSLRIVDEGKQKRREAEDQLEQIEHELRTSLSAASARAKDGRASPT